jgi:hypothetical protein
VLSQPIRLSGTEMCHHTSSEWQAHTNFQKFSSIQLRMNSKLSWKSSTEISWTPQKSSVVGGTASQRSSKRRPMMRLVRNQFLTHSSTILRPTEWLFSWVMKLFNNRHRLWTSSVFLPVISRTEKVQYTGCLTSRKSPRCRRRSTRTSLQRRLKGISYKSRTSCRVSSIRISSKTTTLF